MCRSRYVDDDITGIVYYLCSRSRPLLDSSRICNKPLVSILLIAPFIFRCTFINQENNSIYICFGDFLGLPSAIGFRHLIGQGKRPIGIQFWLALFTGPMRVKS